jgi:predicted RNA-binding Zn-ribbon protein involved in translation (DUF1610 family)
MKIKYSTDILLINRILNKDNNKIMCPNCGLYIIPEENKVSIFKTLKCNNCEIEWIQKKTII